MPNKSISFYNEGEETLSDGAQLTVEIAKNHLACIAKKHNNRAVEAFELFVFNQEESENFEHLISSISNQSKVLSTKAPVTSVYINNEYCVPVPIFVFNKDIAAEYLKIACGEMDACKILFEHLPIEPGIINTFTIESQQFDWMNQNWARPTFHHTYSSIIRRISGSSMDNSHVIIVQFYDTFMIATAVKNGSLQLIQSFVYDNPEDVLYYLLNIAQQLEMSTESLAIRISGMINLEFKLYRELITYFKTVVVENGDESHSKVNVVEHPIHYFTPFFNLAI